MGKKEAQKLKIGDRVVFTDVGPDLGIWGEVVEANWCAIKVRWDMGGYSIYPHDQAGQIGKLGADIAALGRQSP